VLGLLTALAADAPEVSSAIAALVRGKHDVGVGVVLGSNVFNVAAMIGLSAILCGRIRIRRRALAIEGAVGIAATLIAGALILKLLGPWVTLVLLAVVIVPYLALLGRFGERHRPDHVLAPGEREQAVTELKRLGSRALCPAPALGPQRGLGDERSGEGARRSRDPAGARDRLAGGDPFREVVCALRLGHSAPSKARRASSPKTANTTRSSVCGS